MNSLCSQLESGVENDERGPCREVVALLILIDLAKTKRLRLQAKLSAAAAAACRREHRALTIEQSRAHYLFYLKMFNRAVISVFLFNQSKLVD